MVQLRVLVLLGLILAGCAPRTAGPTVDSDLAAEEADRMREAALYERLIQQRELLDIGVPIMMGNAEFCGDRTRYYTGIEIMHPADVAPEYRGALRRLTDNSDDRLIVTHIVPGSPADGILRSGDLIEVLDSIKATSESIPRLRAKLIQSGIRRFEVSRNGQRTSLEVSSVKGCDFALHLIGDDRVNAFADGDGIFVTTGMMRFAQSDQELALVVAHELAHNTMGHIDAKQGNAVAGAVVGGIFTALTGINFIDLGMQLGAGAYSQEFEAEADYVGVYLAERGGFDMSGAELFWRRMAANNPASIHLEGTTHPSAAARFLAIRTASEEIAEKRKANLPLIPETRQVGPVTQPPEDLTHK